MRIWLRLLIAAMMLAAVAALAIHASRGTPEAGRTVSASEPE